MGTSGCNLVGDRGGASEAFGPVDDTHEAQAATPPRAAIRSLPVQRSLPGHMVVGRDTHMHCDTHGCYDKGLGVSSRVPGSPLLSLASHLSHAHLCRFGPSSASGCEKVKKSILELAVCKYGRGFPFVSPATRAHFPMSAGSGQPAPILYLPPPPFLVRHGIPSVAVHAAAAAAAADADAPAGPSEAHRLPFPAVPTSGRISVARAAVLRRSFWFHTRPVLAGWIAP
ncbi:hypothetical protein S7711_11581 [Stachybotrys chartarum IBT 7711]|uniref:Uncharacterized protein n=1 Tax=Stachybotrys chartarum (strain CBS 109288 / IBT 7711) TaxID=1280523 RepID=A0A084AU54_STACB|nr:hypothetical protein S7711_11581 [Stachybotrys chartarum IBT 7711]